jgi:hypothetical protein
VHGRLLRAWGARKKFGDAATYIPARYGQPFPKHKIPPDSKVYLQDYSYKRAEMEDIADYCAELTVIDHHDSAFKELVGWQYAVPLARVSQSLGLPQFPCYWLGLLSGGILASILLTSK